MVAPLAILLVALFLWPMIQLTWIAFGAGHVTLQHFVEFAYSRASVNALLTTVRISAIVTALALVLGGIVAWELCMTSARWKRVLLWAAVLCPLWMGVVVKNYAFTIILQRHGIANDFIQAIGLSDHPLDLLYNSRAVTIGMLYTMLPFAVFPLYSTFVGIDPSLPLAAESLGASRPMAIASVFLPLALPGFMAAGAIVFVVSVGFYVTPVLLGGPQAPFLANRIDTYIHTNFNVPAAATASVVLLVAAVAIIALAWRIVGFERIRRAAA
jgi:putative spermidine/putrescine transport system permease protein